MTERIQILKGAIRILFASSFVLVLLFVVSCDNSDDPGVEPYDMSGKYIFEEAILQSDVNLTLDLSVLGLGEIPYSITAPEDITDEMAGGLLNEAPCDNPENGAVELKSNKDLYFTCLTETNEEKAGLWNYDESSNVLDLNLSAPPLPSQLQLKIENVVIDEVTGTISGSIENFPLTPDLLAGFIPSNYLDLLTLEQIASIIAGLPPATLVDVDIKFKKVN